MQATREEMRAEAAKRLMVLDVNMDEETATRLAKERGFIKQLGLGPSPYGDDGSDGIDEADLFVYAFRGELYKIVGADIEEGILAQVREAEDAYGSYIYFIHKLESNGTPGSMDLYAFFYVSPYPGDWANERAMGEEGLVGVIAPVYGFGGFETGSVRVRPTGGSFHFFLRTD